MHGLAVRVPGARAAGARSCTWPSRSRPARCAVASAAPRPTVPTPSGCASCLYEGRLPESWAPPEHVRQWRSRARLRNTLVAERTSWTQRIRATLYHHGIPGAPDELRTLAGRRFLAGLELPVDAHERITIALEIIDLLDAQLAELERDLRALARHQAGCQALMTQYGMGEISALVTLCELGDVTRLHASRQAVRLAGIDIGVHRSDRHAQLGKLTRQGSAPLRWALFEAAQSASHKGSPDYHDYHALKARGLSHTRASLTIARKLARRSYHLLRALGPAALDPPAPPLRPSPPITDALTACGQLQQRSRHPRPRVAAHQRQSGRSRSTGTTDQPSSHRPPPHAAAGPDKAGRPRSQTPHPASLRRTIHDRRATPHTNTQPPPQARTNSTALTPRPELR